MDKPFLYPFAKDGDRNTELPSANATDNSVSFQSGFTLPYELNPANGGKNLERKDMNEILFRICDAINSTSQEIDKWIILTTENLNDIKQPGRYNQRQSVLASATNNYPVDKAGFLIVVLTGQYALTQIYKGWQNDKIYIRRNESISQDSDAWTAWDSFVLTSEFNNKITALQNTDMNLNNNKEDKTYYHTQHFSNLNNVKDNRFYHHGTNVANAFSTATNYIFNMGAENGAWVRQISFPCTSNEIGVRRTTTKGSLANWTAWDSVALKSFTESTYRKIADSYSKTETNNFLNQKEDKKKITLQRTENANWNNQKTQGWYYANANGTNKPNGNAMWGIVINREIDIIYQELHQFNNGKIWSRQCENGVWSAWDSLMLTSEANSTYRKIADSYTKTEVNKRINNAVNSTHRYKALRCNPKENTIQWQTGGLSISKVNNSTFRITHNLGTTNYCVTCTSNKFGSLGAAASNVINIQPNYCDIASYWGGDNTNGSGLPTMINVAIFY